MPNILDAAPIDALARRIAARVGEESAGARFARLAFDELVNDARNFRPSTISERKAAGPWAEREDALGREVAVFAPNRLSVARLRRCAAALAETCTEIAEIAAIARAVLKPRDLSIGQSAREFIAKIERASYETLEVKARFYARQRKNRLAEIDAALPLFPREEIYSSPGRVWRRVLSIGELWEVGAEFRNCLARTSRHISTYARRLRDGDAQFWVLRDHEGKGLIVVMAALLAPRIAEARGPRNAVISPDHPDLVHLARAKGWSDTAAHARALGSICGDAGEALPHHLADLIEELAAPAIRRRLP